MKLQFTLVAVGHYANKTIKLNGLQYTNGEAEIEGSATELETLMSYHAKCFQAFPKGSLQLAAAQERYDAEMAKLNGKDEDATENLQHEAGPQGGTDSVNTPSSEDQGSGDGAGHDDPANGPAGVLSEGSSDEAGSDGSPESEQSPVTEGGNVLPENPADPSSVNEENKELAAANPMLNAVTSLDPSVDDHWTEDGRPALKAIEAALGTAGITRDEVEAAAPDWSRAKAVELKEMS